MDKLVHVIHPYTYKLQRRDAELHLIIGDISEYLERDSKFSEFLNFAIKSNVRILHHRDKHQDSIEGAIVDLSLRTDKFYKVLFGDNIETVVTLPTGSPLLDRRPEKISEDVWQSLADFFTSNTELERKVGKPDLQLFIGGAFEACLHQSAVYARRFYCPNGRICVVNDLSVCFDQVARIDAENVLQQANIDVISYELALDLLKK